MASNMTLLDFQRWKVPELREFLRKRGIAFSSKKKEELVALVYAAHSNQTPLKISESESCKIKSDDYRSLLVTSSGKTFPDPFTDLPSGWISEKDGMHKWPPTMQIDISTYILNHVDTSNRNLTQRLLSDYKEGKAYSYFDSKWLKEVLINTISPESEICILKSQSTPSERINDIPDKIWVAIEKKTGTVQSAYCTCFAGLGSTCNHVAAVLFKIDYAWKEGLCNKSCTSAPCSWNQYGAKRTIQPKPVSEIEWRKPHYKKKGSRTMINPIERQLFTPAQKQDSEPCLKDIVNSFFSSCPRACGFSYLKNAEFQGSNYSPEDECNVENYIEVATSEPTNLLDFAASSDNFEIKFTCDQIADIETITRSQSDSDEWKKQRIGRITSSNAHRVLVKFKALNSGRPPHEIDTTTLINDIMGYKELPSYLPALKYGKNMESEARSQYELVMKSTGHKMTVDTCGLHVSKECIYIAASPDGLVNCKCCGSGLLEIKCPLTAAHIHPADANLPYLKRHSNGFYLNKNNPYYSQVQHQLGVTERHWCDFFVFSRHGHIIIRIQFDQVTWNELVSASRFFFTNYIKSELLENPSAKCQEEKAPIMETASCSLESSPPSLCTSSSVTQGNKKANKGIKRVKYSKMPMYCCGFCNNICREPNTHAWTENDNSVQCDKCRLWFHWNCVQFSGETSKDFLCSKCKE